MNRQARASLQIRLLGGFAITAADGTDLTPPGKKLRALIACLALQPGAAWSRERLTALLWGGREDEQARGSLRQALAELRRSLGESTLQTDRETVALDPSTVSVDAVEFARSAKAGDMATAAQLYSGDLLEGVTLPDGGFGDWLLVERTRLHDLGAGVLARLAGSQSDEAAVATAQRLLQLEPTREETHRTLMRLYAARGDRAQALRQYQTCRDALQRELGVKPDAETEQLCRDIQTGNGAARGAQAQDGSPPDGPTDLTPTAVPQAREVQPAQDGTNSGAQQNRRWLWPATLATVLLLVGVGGLAWHLLRKEPVDRAHAIVTPEAALGLPVILVLPFQDLTPGSAQNDLGLGITEELRSLLWSTSEFQVVGNPTDVSAENGPAELKRMAQEYHASFVIKGTIRRTGYRAVIIAQLIDGTTGVDLWSSRFEEAVTDPVALESAAASKLSDALGGMSGKMRRAYERIAWSKAEADLTEYDYYVRGHVFHHAFTKEGGLRAYEIYKAGLKRYPNSILLRAKISLFYITGLWRWSEDPDGDAAQSRRYAREAATILAAGRRTRFEEYYVHWISTYASHIEGDFSRCMEHAEAAIAINSYDAMLLADLSNQVGECGKPSEAVEWAKEAVRIEPEGLPGSPQWYRESLAWSLYLADRCPEALSVIDELKDKPRMTLAACQVRVGRLDDARRTMADFVQHTPDWTLADEKGFPIQMVEPLRQRWFADMRAAGLPD
jgi:DNA-binding SARP family transcriptional activator/TolB-like protein